MAPHPAGRGGSHRCRPQFSARQLVRRESPHSMHHAALLPQLTHRPIADRAELPFARAPPPDPTADWAAIELLGRLIALQSGPHAPALLAARRRLQWAAAGHGGRLANRPGMALSADLLEAVAQW